MTLINQLEQTVTEAVADDDTNVAQTSLLEQFYAIFIMRLAQPMVYSQLLRSHQDISATSNTNAVLFKQVWQSPAQRQRLIDELSATHHVTAATTEQLLVNASQLTYQVLKNQAQGQFLPAFLQTQQASIRQYLPVWAETVLVEPASETSSTPSQTIINSDESTAYDRTSQTTADTADLTASDPAINDMPDNPPEGMSPTEQPAPSSELTSKDSIDVAHVNPAEYREPHTPTDTSAHQHGARQQRNNYIIIGLLLIGLLGAIGMVWLLVLQPNASSPAEPPVAMEHAATTVTATAEPVQQTVAPTELVVAVDNTGSLYHCTAVVGNVTLQNMLKQALEVSFAEQSNACELTVKQGVATRFSGIDTKTLPDLFTLLRSVPFARLQLQDDTINLEAPDAELLQSLVADMRSLIPQVTITAAAPLPLTENNDLVTDNNNEGSALPDLDDEFNTAAMMTDANNEPTSDTQENNSQAYQALDDDIDDPALAAPNYDDDIHDTQPPVPAGPISAAEVDALARTTIVAEQLRNERPVDEDIVPNE